MAIFDNSIITRIQQANDIVDVIAEHVALKRKGREMIGVCPFHDDHRPSMNVSPAKQIFKCFACGAGGDVFKFVQMQENLSFPQAVRRLAERAGIKIDSTKYQRRAASGDIDPNDLARLNSWAAKYFAKNLADKEKGKSAREYLAERKISPDSIKKFRLGLALDEPDHLSRAAAGAKISQTLLLAAGLTVPGGTARFVNRLMFPIMDVTARVIGFGGRTLSGDAAKYINSPATALFDKSNALYGLELARHEIVAAATAVVVEGYTDCIMAHQFGFKNIVASLGTSFTEGHARILRRYAKKVVLLFDADTAGIEAANRALKTALAGRIDIALATVPDGKDPYDFLLAQGKGAFEKLIGNPIDVFTFKWNRLVENLDASDTIAGKKQAVDDFLDAVAVGIRSGTLPAIEKGLIVNRLAKIVAIEPNQLNAELRRRTARASRAAGPSRTGNLENQQAKRLDFGAGLAANAQREILEVLLNAPALLKSSGLPITADTFDVPELRQIAVIILDLLEQNFRPALTDILARTESTATANLIVALADAGEKKGNFKARLSGALDAIRLIQKEKEKTRISQIKDPKKFIKRLTENTDKQNPRSVGMV